MGRIRHPTQQVAVNFTVQGTGGQAQQLYQAYSITVDRINR